MDEIKESGESHAEVSGPIRSRSTKHLQSKKKGSIIMLKKRLMSMFLALTMVVGLGSQVFAVETNQVVQYRVRSSENNTITKIVHAEIPHDITNSENVSFEEYGQSKLYTYTTDDFIYTVQFGVEGAVCFSFVSLKDGTLYQSDVFNISDFGWNDLGIDPDDQIEAGKEIIRSSSCMELTEFSTKEIAGTNTQRLVTSSSLNDHLIEIFGADFKYRLLASEYKEWDRSYLMRVHGNQTTLQQTARVIDFKVGATVASIKAWLSAGKFKCSVKWFLDAMKATIVTLDGVEMIDAALRGEAYQYRCERVQRVTCPTYPDEIFYNASWVIECGFFRKTNGYWNDYQTNELHQPLYDDYSQLLANGFTQLLNRHVL